MIINGYPRVSKIIPIQDMYKECSGHKGTIYLPIAALVIFEEGNWSQEHECFIVKQYFRYLDHSQLNYLEEQICNFKDLEGDDFLGIVHKDDISQESWNNSNIGRKHAR